jgi:hypothetical protein
MSKACGKNADHVVYFKKLAEGGFKRVFRATLTDGSETIALLPYPATIPEGLGIASEVASMAFLQTHSIPVSKVYGYLPSFVARGKVQAVRELLSAGCNPVTKAKPRWAPIYNAIRGASDKHNKCLTALLAHGANVNATRSSNGRTTFHYAIELEPWAGYSTLLYILLVKSLPRIPPSV